MLKLYANEEAEKAMESQLAGGIAGAGYDPMQDPSKMNVVY